MNYSCSINKLNTLNLDTNHIIPDTGDTKLERLYFNIINSLNKKETIEICNHLSIYFKEISDFYKKNHSFNDLNKIKEIKNLTQATHKETVNITKSSINFFYNSKLKKLILLTTLCALTIIGIPLAFFYAYKIMTGLNEMKIIQNSLDSVNREYQKFCEISAGRQEAAELQIKILELDEQISQTNNKVKPSKDQTFSKRIEGFESKSMEMITFLCSHFHRPVIGVEIPEADPTIDFRHLIKEFDAVGLKKLIKDDGRYRSIQECRTQFEAYINMLASERVYTDIYGKVGSLELVNATKNILRHLTFFFTEQNPSQEIRQDIIKRIAITFFHCSNRLATELRDIYLEYITKEANLIAGEKSLENRLLKYLYLARIDSLTEASIINGDHHPAATHTYVRRHLSHEYGIRDDAAAGDKNYSTFSMIQSKDLDLIRIKINSTYNPTAVVDRLCQDIMDPENKRIYFDEFASWFKERGMEYQDFTVMDDNGDVTIRKGAVWLFLDEHELI